VLDLESPTLALVFCRTRLEVDELAERLVGRGYRVASLHGGMGQAERDRVMARARAGTVDLLVATDVASRGLDIPTVDLVVNVDVPAMPSDYIHRVGRTARAGRAGHAVTLVTQYDVELLGQIETAVLGGTRLRPLPGVSEADVLPRLSRVAVALELAKARLAESGIADALAVKKARRWRGTEDPQKQRRVPGVGRDGRGAEKGGGGS
jgi:ATP-dependent RNA helicase DeaD